MSKKQTQVTPVTVGVRLEPREFQRLEQLAADAGLTKSDVLRAMLRSTARVETGVAFGNEGARSDVQQESAW